jgi:hypothetical protein
MPTLDDIYGGILKPGPEGGLYQPGPEVQFPKPATTLNKRVVQTVAVDPFTGNPITSGGAVRSAVTQGTQPAGTVQMPPGARPAAVDRAFAQMPVQPPPAPLPPAPAPVRTAGGIYNAKPPPAPPVLPSDPRLPKGTALAFDPGGAPSNPAVSAISAATSPAPRLPMSLTAQMMLARSQAGQSPMGPSPSARPPASIPLEDMGTVNPVSQVIPALQARIGKSGIGRLFNAATAGVVPQASISRPEQITALQQQAKITKDPEIAKAMAAGKTSYVSSNASNNGVLGPNALMPTVAMNGKPIRNR